MPTYLGLQQLTDLISYLINKIIVMVMKASHGGHCDIRMDRTPGDNI